MASVHCPVASDVVEQILRAQVGRHDDHLIHTPLSDAPFTPGLPLSLRGTQTVLKGWVRPSSVDPSLPVRYTHRTRMAYLTGRDQAAVYRHPSSLYDTHRIRMAYLTGRDQAAVDTTLFGASVHPVGATL